MWLLASSVMSQCAQLDARQETCRTTCIWCAGRATVFGWYPIYPTTTIIAATVITSIDTVNHVTTTTLITNELPDGYKLPPTNSLGTRIVDVGTGLIPFPNGYVVWPSTYQTTSYTYGTETFSFRITDTTSMGCFPDTKEVTYHPSIRPSPLNLTSQSRTDSLLDPGGLLYTFGQVNEDTASYGVADPSPLTVNIAGCSSICVSGNVNQLTGPGQFMTSQIIISGDQTTYLPPTLAVPSLPSSSPSSPAVTSTSASPAPSQTASPANSGTVPTTSSRTQSSESSVSYPSPKKQILFSLAALVLLAYTWVSPSKQPSWKFCLERIYKFTVVNRLLEKQHIIPRYRKCKGKLGKAGARSWRTSSPGTRLGLRSSSSFLPCFG